MQENDKKGSYAQYMSNPRSYTLKRWLSEILQEDYPPHDILVERISSALATSQDIEDFGKLVMQIYYKAYHRAVNDYKEQAEKMGLKIVISTKEAS